MNLEFNAGTFFLFSQKMKYMSIGGFDKDDFLNTMEDEY